MNFWQYLTKNHMVSFSIILFCILAIAIYGRIVDHDTETFRLALIIVILMATVFTGANYYKFKQPKK